MSQTTMAPATAPPPDEPHPDGLAATGPTAGPAPVGAPPVTINVNGNGASSGSGQRSGGAREALHRMDGYSTTSEFVRWAEQVRQEHTRRHDAYLAHAGVLEEGIKKTSKWPWSINKVATARRASRPLRQNAGAELDAARRISVSVRVLLALKDAPKTRTGRGFDATR